MSLLSFFCKKQKCAGARTQGLIHAEQALSSLGYSSSPFCSVFLPQCCFSRASFTAFSTQTLRYLCNTWFLFLFKFYFAFFFYFWWD
jgi:hypothetical protein